MLQSTARPATPSSELQNSRPAGRHVIGESAPFPHQLQPATVYTANSEIYAQGERASAIYQIAFGAVRIYRLLADGRRQISAFHFVGEVFGLESGDRHEFFAEAISNAGVRTVKTSANGDLANHLLPVALLGLARAQRHLLLLGRQTALEKVAAFLVDMAERQGNDNHVDLPMQRGDIGDYLGLTLETVSRVFSKLKETGTIRMKTARSIEIVDMDVLEAMSE